MMPKIDILSKNVPNKSRRVLNFVQEIRLCVCLSPPGVELGGYKDCHLRNILML